MGKKVEKKEPAKVDQVFVLGLDANGKPCGARFSELEDSIASAAMDMNCRLRTGQPEAVSALAMTLPVGRAYGTGKAVKLFVPNIRRELYDKILEAARIAAEAAIPEPEAAAVQQATGSEAKDPANVATSEPKCISPITSGLPPSSPRTCPSRTGHPSSAPSASPAHCSTA
jgi:hypothetical protein